MKCARRDGCKGATADASVLEARLCKTRFVLTIGRPFSFADGVSDSGDALNVLSGNQGKISGGDKF